jgi:hypothetical protein
MNNVNLGGAFSVDKLDADAVCAQCSTVNAEGTLLCKVCGNNLRDQRTRRLQADQVMDMEHTGQRRRAWLSGLLFILAIGLIVATLVNQELIVDWLINVQAPADPALAELWAGDYDAYFQPMVEELDLAGVDGESAAAALAAGPVSTELEGLYALYDGDVFVGTANVRLEGEEAYFVAQLTEGNEVRGVARSESDHFIALPDFSAISGERGRLSSISGVALIQGDGVLECKGNSGSDRVTILAQRLPDP